MTQRVVLVSPYALNIFGGAQEQVLAMSRELCRRGRSVLVVAPNHSDNGPHDTPAAVRTFGPLALVRANGSRAPITLSPLAARRARVAIEQFRPDVVHYHEPVAPLLAYGALARHRAPAVGTFHRAGLGPAYRVARPTLRRLVGQLDVATAVSMSAAETIKAAVGLPTEVLFNGFETERLRQFPRERAVPPTVLFVGRLEPRKGARTVVEAAARYGESWRTVILGDGPDRAVLQRLAAGLSIEFLGAADDETKRRWLRRADVVVAASTHGESFGLVVLEPMAAEARVVASDIPGYRAAAGDLAEYFTPGDADSLGAAVSRALSGDEGVIALARRHAEGWSMHRLMDRYVAIYEDAAARFRAGSLRR